MILVSPYILATVALLFVIVLADAAVLVLVAVLLGQCVGVHGGDGVLRWRLLVDTVLVPIELL